MNGGIPALLAQAQKLQKNVERIQNELRDTIVIGESGAGAVKVEMTCRHEARRIEIDAKLLSSEPEDKEMLEDLIAAAINDAARKAEETSTRRMKEASAGIPLPSGVKLPF